MEPTRLGPYTIRHRIGRGGMGTVYEAEDADGGLVAVKTLSAHLGDDAGLRRRFEAEIEALKGLRHPGIVRILAFGEQDGRPFFAMELVPGRSLEEILKTGRTFSWRETVTLAGEIVRALKAAHDSGIVHRDLKPANLLVVEAEGGPARVRLADFGIARLFGETGQTQAGTVVGTAEYMAPEQAVGGPVDQRVDLYALGLVMYAMLTGRPPFRGGEVADVLRRQQRETPARVSAIVPGVPAAVDALIEKLLAKDPADRPANALAVARMLAAVEQAPEPTPAEALRADPPEADEPAERAAQPEQPTGVDLLAATRVTQAGEQPRLETRRSARLPAEGSGLRPTLPFTPATGSESLAHRPTQPAAAPTQPSSPATNRFTTVEDFDRSLRERARRQSRRDGVVRLAVACGILGIVAAGGYLASRPPTADAMHARILAIAEDPAADLRDAAGLIDAFLARHPDDPRATAIRGFQRLLAVDALERQARRRPRKDVLPGPLERDYRAAIAREQDSPLACLTALEAMLAVHASAAAEPSASAGDGDASLWLDLVRRQIDRVAPLAAREREEDVARVAAALAEATALADQAAAAADPADRDRLLARRRDLLAGLVEMYAGRPHVAAALHDARRLLESP